MRALRITIFTLATLTLGAELVLRAMGVGDFPLYDANNEIGYIPKANQQGALLNKNHWIFNAQHMGAGEFKPGPGRDVLLVGDSLVYGGNAYSQPERLGPSLARHLPAGSQVWPIAAGSWSVHNELTWLMRHPEVVRQVDDVVFVFNSGDLENTGSSWRCQSTHPTKAPVSLLWYTVVKQMRLENCPDVPEGMAVPDRPWRTTLKAWLASPEVQGKRVHFVLYPDKNEFQRGGKPMLPQMENKLQQVGVTRALDVGNDPRWNLSLFKDGIHPTPEGNEVLGTMVAEYLSSPLP
jgi:hypothetical protein